jgi:hypothetical protein
MLIGQYSYLLAMSPIAEHMPCLAALFDACNALAPASCTLHSPLAATPSSRS